MSKKWILLLAALAPSSAMAQTQSQWDYSATMYGWFPGVTTSVATPLGTVESEVGFDEIFDHLDLAFLGAVEARKGRLTLAGDLQYFDVGAEAKPPVGAPTATAEVDSKMLVFGAYAAYAVVDQPDLRFDLGAGLRYIDASFEAKLNGQGSAPATAFQRDGGWTDGIIAARVQRQFNARWFGVAYADVGGFGVGDSSDLTWQAFAGAGYRINDKWSAFGGYRHLSVEREFKGFDVTSEVSGPFLGAQVKF